MAYEGTVVLNYRLTKKLGEGGFGAVYLAEHTDLGRQVACKILHPQYARDPDIVERFFREAKAVTAIGHKAIVSIENFGTLPGGEPFYLMEFFAGTSLDDLAKERHLTSEQLVAIFEPIADALAAAHSRGIIHRDLKPDNIMVRMDGDRVADVRLLDFGIAKLLDGESYSMTGGAMGTPSYMAPEQALDAKHIDARADVYAFAATLYAAVSGRPPFSGTTAAAILVKAQTEAVEPLELLRAGVTAELGAITTRCLAKQPQQRPSSIAHAWGELKTALLRAPLGGAITTNAHAATIYASPSAVATQIPATAPDPYPAGRRSRAPLFVVGGIALAVVAGGAIFIAKRTGSAPKPDAAVVALAPDAEILTPPDAAVVMSTPDAAEALVVVDAAPVVADAAIAPPDAPAKTPPKPKATCTEASFAQTIATGTEPQVQAALTRLKGCKDKLDVGAYARIQQALVGKL